MAPRAGDRTRASALELRRGVLDAYPDVLTPEALEALEALAPLDDLRRDVMNARARRRLERARHATPIVFPDPGDPVPGTDLTAADARAGRFEGAEIPRDLLRQWIQGTGTATRPRATIDAGLRNVAYALLSGADGWMFDGEDGPGQVDTVSLDNIR